jgi:hypothetical protein
MDFTLRELDGTLLMEDGTAAAPGLSFASDPDSGIFRGGANEFGIATNGVERVEFGTSEVVFNDGGANYDFRIEGDTNTSLFFVDASAEAVGIGTASASTILHVASTAPYIRIQDTDSSTGVTAQGGFEMYDSDGDRLFYLANESDSSSDVSLFNVAGGALKFGTSGSERGQFDSSGRLLVGTSTARTNYFAATDALTPNVQLEASRGGLAILGTANGSDLFIGKGSSVTAADDFLGEICFTGFDGTNNRTAARILCQTDAACGSGDMPGRIVLATTADGASSATERMRITSGGQTKVFSSSTTRFWLIASRAQTPQQTVFLPESIRLQASMMER